MESHWKVSKIIFNWLYFFTRKIFSGYFSQKIGQEGTEISCITSGGPPYQSGSALPLSTSPIRVVHLFTIDGPTLTYYYPLKSIIYVRVHLWYCTFCGFGMTCIHHYTMQSTLTALKILHVSPIHLSFPSALAHTTDAFASLLSFAFFRSHIVGIIQ